ncbi:hypothetical protein [Desulfoferula mesophila]|uniref:Uncharacterized protein n=1 Tax=Desulfoferula mesophila TaxID=3058419 RepID=A0AAU9EJX2_9BACT|nr:hypothetical protein FAK_40910 [Desulfoferula mesophilus]
MSERQTTLVLVDPDERQALSLGGAVFYYRRLSLGALAAIERQQLCLLPADQGRGPRPWLPPQALEAALAAHALVGWEGVSGPEGEPVPYSPAAALRLPVAVRRRLVRRAQSPQFQPGEKT